ncbi:MAG: hypothetical protein ACRDT0_10915, partial [Pseudonocardiaceae bacterium]
VSGVRWVLSPVDFRAHVLAETADGSLGVWIARCGHGMPSEAGVDPVPRGAACPSCALVTDADGFDWFGTGP